MKLLRCGVLLIATCFLLLHGDAAVGQTRSSVGLVSKVVLDVTKKDLDRDWQKAERGEMLSSGDRVKTGEKSLAVIKFKDNSLVRVRERSELTVTGAVSGAAFSKSVNVDNGGVGFNIRKQQADEEFRFTSPTSVASIRGTGGLFTSASQSDTLIVTDGLVNFLNKISSESVDVPAGFTGISNSDGSIVRRVSTADEHRIALEAARASDQDNRLEFEFRDRQGERKQLKIDYKR